MIADMKADSARWYTERYRTQGAGKDTQAISSAVCAHAQQPDIAGRQLIAHVQHMGQPRMHIVSKELPNEDLHTDQCSLSLHLAASACPPEPTRARALETMLSHDRAPAPT
jgi:hypothetical protein